jgi:hypothetical protein
LIVTSTDEVRSLNLPELTLPSVEFLDKLSRGLSIPTTFNLGTFIATRRYELDARIFGGKEGRINVDSDNVFRELLADLWNTIVQPVLKALKLKASRPFLMHHILAYAFAEIS